MTAVGFSPSGGHSEAVPDETHYVAVIHFLTFRMEGVFGAFGGAV